MNEAPVENGFFRWVKETGLRRSDDHWIGGVAAGVAERFNLSPILVRGIFVALTFLAGLGLLVYGVAWAVLPGPDGRILVQEVVAGHWSSSMTWALLFFIGGTIGFPWFFSWWDGGFWTFLVIGAIIFVIFSRRGRFAEGTRQTTGAPYPGPPNAHGNGNGNGSFNTQPTNPAESQWNAQYAAASAQDASRDFERPGSTAAASSTPEGASAPSAEAPTTSFGPITQEQSMSLTSREPSNPPKVESSLPRDESRTTAGQPSATDWTGNRAEERKHGNSAGSGFTPPPTPPTWTRAPKPPRNRAMPGYVATIVLGFAVLVFALIVGLHQLGMLELPSSPVAIGLAAALIVIALGIIGASLNQRTGGALTGFGIVVLILSLIWSGGALRAADINVFSNGITTVNESGSTNVFHSGEMDLRNYSTITEDTTVSVDNVFSSVKLIVPDNIPVELEFSGAFTSLSINGSSASSSGNSSTMLNAGASGPTLHIELDGAFNSVEVSAQKAEVAP